MFCKKLCLKVEYSFWEEFFGVGNNKGMIFINLRKCIRLNERSGWIKNLLGYVDVIFLFF